MEKRDISHWSLIFAGSIIIIPVTIAFLVYGRIPAPILVISSISALPLAIRAFFPPLAFGQGVFCFFGGLLLGGTLLSIHAPDWFFILRAIAAAVLLIYGFRKPKDKSQN